MAKLFGVGDREGGRMAPVQLAPFDAMQLRDDMGASLVKDPMEWGATFAARVKAA
jgi:hypothetical protein